MGHMFDTSGIDDGWRSGSCFLGIFSTQYDIFSHFLIMLWQLSTDNKWITVGACVCVCVGAGVLTDSDKHSEAPVK